MTLPAQYVVTKLEECGDEFKPAYKVVGPKKTWFLYRNKPQPHMLFPIAEISNSPRGEKIAGHTWFYDKEGTLEALR
jgi:hypothetical protein